MTIRLIFILLLGASFSSTGQQLTDGLVFLHNFNGNTVDESGNGLDLLENGPVLTEDRFGNSNSAYFWDGIDDFLEIPSSPLIKIDPPVSFSLWVNAESVDQQYMKFFKTDLVPLDYNGYFLSGYPPFNGESDVLISTGGGIGHTGPNNRRSKRGSSISPNTWHHIAVVIRDPLDMDLYIDCVDVGGTYSGSGPTTISHTSATGRLGSVLETVGVPPRFFWGSMDQFAMWDRALSAADVTKICDGQLETEQITSVVEQVDEETPSETTITESTVIPSIRIFPVPSSYKVTVESSVDLYQPQISVINTAGQRIKDFKLLTLENRSFTLDIHHLPKGIYHGTIETADRYLRFTFVRQ